jgi:type IV secretory pathway VirB10-like protein
MDEQKKTKIAIAAAIVLALVVGGIIFHGCCNEKQQEKTKIMQYNDTEKPDKVEKKLDITPKESKEIVREIQYIHSGETAPNVTYYTTAPTVEAAATQTAKDIDNNNPSLPKEATEKTDRTIVTTDNEKQKVDVYKINLRNNHKIKAGVLVTSGRAYPGVGYQAGRWEGMAYMSGKTVVAGSVTYTVKEW